MHSSSGYSRPVRPKSVAIATWIAFVSSLAQLVCSVAIICIIRYDLEAYMTVTTGDNYGIFSYTCLMSSPDFAGSCQYAYSVAAVSILFSFVVSLMQCLTMDCCGAGRLVETLFDGLASAWWAAAGVTLGVNAAKADDYWDVGGQQRVAVVSLCWVSVALFGVLFIANAFLTAKVGKAYHAGIRHPFAPGGGVQMSHMPPYPGGMPAQPYATNYAVGYPQAGHPVYPQQPSGYPPMGPYPQPGTGGGFPPPPGGTTGFSPSSGAAASTPPGTYLPSSTRRT